MVAPSSSPTRRPALSDAKRALLGQMLDRAATPAAAPVADAIPPRPAGATIPLSLSQQSLWFFHQLDPASPLYHIPMALRLEGALDVAALQGALDAVVARHEMLRTRIALVEGAPVQHVLPTAQLPLRQIDLSTTPPDAREAVALTRVNEESCQPFDFAGDTLLRALLIRVGETSHILVLTAHHIVSDGWSWGVLFRELAALYEAQRTGRPAALRELTLQYGDFVLWQRERLGRNALAQELAFWRKELAGAPALLELPSDRPRPAVQTFRGGFEQRTLSPTLTQRLRALARAEGATLFTTLLAAFQVLLHRLSGQPDLVVGTAVAGRTHAQLEDVFGYFVNTLPLRSRLAGDPSFQDFLRQTRVTCLDALSHQEVPFDQLVAELRPARSPSHLPLVQVMFTLQDDRAAAPRLAGIEATRLETPTDTAKFDLSLMISETESTLTPYLEFNGDLFDAETARRWLGHFETLLDGIVTQPALRVSELPLLSPVERAQLIETWNDTRTEYPREATLVSLFEAQVALRGETVAVETVGEKLTYNELNRRANVLARHLRECGVMVDTPVAFCLERSTATIVTLLGILKAGGAYCSLDPDYPAERLAFMLGDLQPKVLLTRRALAARLPAVAGVQVLCLEDISDAGEAEAPNPAPVASPESLAYISYTSGSTGKPKGVCVPHRGVVRLVHGADYARFGADETLMQFAPVAFDGSTFEIWGALLHGARLVVHPPGMPSLSELAGFIERHSVTTIFLTTGLFHALVDHSLKRLHGVRQVLVGGDTLSPAHAQRFIEALPKCRLINGYGPTENTTFTACQTVARVDGPISIGRPIANTDVYILDPHGQPTPIGVPGELWTGGDGLARGYLRRPEITAEKFVAHPFKTGERIYRTGDLARYRADGSIAFLGRMDRQVKLRGFRVELEEIETHLRRFPGVSDGVVTAPEDGTGDRRLTAHVVATNADAEALRAHLRQQLPAHMVPAVVIFVPALPLTANGKVDLRALPAAAADVGRDRPASVAPRDRWEEQLVKIWEAVLGVTPIGVTDRFFDLGGHSLMALRVVAQIEALLGQRVSVTTLFQAQSIRELATVLRGDVAAPVTESPLLALQPQGTQPPLYLVPGVGGGMIWGYINLSRHLGTDQPVYVFRADGAPGDGFETIEAMAARYVRELRTFQPEGPYSIGGYCFGGNVAFEMARILEAQGQQVALLALMNSSPPNSDYYRFRWTIPSLARFAANLFYWLRYFFTWERKLRRDYVQWKLTQLRRTVAGWLGMIDTAQGCGPEEIVNLSALPASERKLYDAHVRALIQYRCGPYQGKVTLLRTRGHPLFCSYDKSYGWREFVRGDVALLPIPGAHESLLQEPHVRAVAAALIGCRASAAPQNAPSERHPATPAMATKGCAA